MRATRSSWRCSPIGSCCRRRIAPPPSTRSRATTRAGSSATVCARPINGSTSTSSGTISRRAPRERPEVSRHRRGPAADGAHGAPDADRGTHGGPDDLCRGDLHHLGLLRRAGRSRLGRRRVHGPVCRDRKSTRLNSSHSSISYAVFCLKKKKNTNKLGLLTKKKKKLTNYK